MTFVPISLDHKPLLTHLFKELNLPFCEYTFANCYLFRKQSKIELFEWKGFYFLRGVSFDKKQFLMPLCNLSLFSIDEIKALFQFAEIIYPLPFEWSSYLSPHFFLETLPDNDDYVFTKEKLSTLKGRRLSSRRNLVHQFLSQYSPVAFPLLKDRLGDAHAILSEWNVNHKLDEETDYEVCCEALTLFEELDLSGTIYYVEEKPVAFIVGEKLTPSMYVIHFEKALPQYKGIYQYINQAFATALASDIVYLNWEEDLGKPGLRQAKTAYEPDLLIKKLRLLCKKN